MTIITSIRVFHETKDRLKGYGTMKDTMDDVLNRLMDKVDDNVEKIVSALHDDIDEQSDKINIRSRELSKNYLMGGKQ